MTKIIGSPSDFHIKVDLKSFWRFGCIHTIVPVPFVSPYANILRLFLGRFRTYLRARAAEFAPCFYRAAATTRRVSSDRTHLQFWHIWRWGITQRTLFAGESALLETERKTKGGEYFTSYVAGTLEYQMILGKILLVHLASPLRLRSCLLRRRWRCLAFFVMPPWIFGASWRKAEGRVHSPSTLPLPLSPPAKFEESLRMDSRARAVYNR